MPRPATPFLVPVLVQILGLPIAAQHGLHLPDPRAGRPLDHRAAESWRATLAAVCSKDGAWLAWVEAPFDGDPELHVAAQDGSAQFRRSAAKDPRFTPDGSMLLCTLVPSREEVRAHARRALERKRAREQARGGEKSAAEREAKDDDEPLPQPGLGVLELPSGKWRILPGIHAWRASDAVAHIVLLQRDVAGERARDKKKPRREWVRYDLRTRESTGCWEDVDELVLAKDDTRFFFVQEERAAFVPKEGDTRPARPARPGGMRVARLDGGAARLLHESRGAFAGPWLDEERRRVVWMHQTRRGDESAKEKRELPRARSWELWHWDGTAAAPDALLQDAAALGAEPELLLTPDRTPQFSRDAGALLVGVRVRPRPDPAAGLPEDEVELDLWHWQDPLLQPHQAKLHARLERRSGLAVWHFAARRWQVLTARNLMDASFATDDGRCVWWGDREPYGPLVSWDASYEDVYVADSQSGAVRRLLSGVRTEQHISAAGHYLLELGRDGQWYCHRTDGTQSACLTEGLGVSFVDERWDRPGPARPYGVLGWAPGDAYVWLYDRYDVWRMRPDGQERLCVTAGAGREAQLRFRHVQLDPEARTIPLDAPLLLSAFDERSMASGFYRQGAAATDAGPEKLVLKHARFGPQVLASKDRKRLFVRISRYDLAEDLWAADADFAELRRISNTNPQQAEYRWGKAELVRWRGLGGEDLTGILIKPDGFDPQRRYPMMVHFYERRSESLHRYRLPHPGTSPSASFYVSRGYLWFIPDIQYEIGRPGQSALNCIVPGVLSIVARGYVDAARIGVAGHSWGGYQVAYLVTHSKIFSAAEAGAPVANMTSAYGGLRHGEGVSRMFQYERTQSRIGGSLWERQREYLESSPLFRADQITTPLLILHNDGDGAVPWQQGIELFTALRRLGKEAYLLNYCGEPHGLRRKANQRDWARRMQEFFDHHLRGTPAPTWIREGVPHADRAREKADRARAEAALSGAAQSTGR